MNDSLSTQRITAELSPLPALLTAYARPAERHWQSLCWLLDQRLAAVVQRGGEPTIAAIRLSWWDAVLVEDDRSKGGGEPLVEAWRREAPEGMAAAAGALIDGWRTLLGSEVLTHEDIANYGVSRGGGLFRLIANRSDSERIARAGAVWALWDLAGHVREPGLAEVALEEAKLILTALPELKRAEAPKPLRLLFALVARDVRAGRVPKGFEARHYRTLLWRALLS